MQLDAECAATRGQLRVLVRTISPYGAERPKPQSRAERASERERERIPNPESRGRRESRLLLRRVRSRLRSLGPTSSGCCEAQLAVSGRVLHRASAATQLASRENRCQLLPCCLVGSHPLHSSAIAATCAFCCSPPFSNPSLAFCCILFYSLLCFASLRFALLSCLSCPLLGCFVAPLADGSKQSGRGASATCCRERRSDDLDRVSALRVALCQRKACPLGWRKKSRANFRRFQVLHTHNSTQQKWPQVPISSLRVAQLPKPSNESRGNCERL